ncbi:hypothetical protein [Catellatospora vulcania]|uniref:hypothetical protein n=1 Tax=Catellatospora vulcania TaxID=1460450 RepID=UPI0012D4BDAF|nr:hypothetical protein [Catellatospora vulcania]
MSVDKPTSSTQATVTVLDVLEPRMFDRCPICGDPATSDEHVPAQSLHGHVMTRTCEPCNNGLGSRVEPALLDWYDNAISLSKLSGGSVPGQRHAGRLLLRYLPDGEYVLLQDGPYDPAIAEILRSGEVDLKGALPNDDHVRLALLKNAYLAACLTFGIWEGEYADEIRADLKAARDAGSRQEIPRSRLARGLTFFRLCGPPPVNAPAVAVARADDPAGPIPGVVLAGRIFVSWTSDLGATASAAADDRLATPLVVGPAVTGPLLRWTPPEASRLTASDSKAADGADSGRPSCPPRASAMGRRRPRHKYSVSATHGSSLTSPVGLVTSDGPLYRNAAQRQVGTDDRRRSRSVAPW